MEEQEKIYTVINLAAADKSPSKPQTKINRAGWVGYGDKNLFPQEVLNYNSPVNSAIIASTVTYICGKGVRDSEVNAEKYVGVPNPSESWDDVIEKIATDYKTFGGFYFQIIKNQNATTVSLFHQDFSEVRIGQITEEGEPLTFRLSKDWTKTSGKNKPIEVEAWPGMGDAKNEKAYIFHYWDYTPGMDFYCIPHYYSARHYLEADGQLGLFYRNSINNGFTPSAIMTMTSNPEQDKKDAFQKSVEKAYAGANGASSIIVVWGESEGTGNKIAPFVASSNADVYNNVESIVFQKIISAHRLSSPTLAGVAGTGNLSGNAAEIIDAYVLYNYTVIEKLRRKILDKLNIFTKINKTGVLEIEELDVLPKIRETEDTEAALSEAPNKELQTLRRDKFKAFLKKLLSWK